MEPTMVNREVNRTVVSAMAKMAMMFRVLAAIMERKPRRRMHLRLDTFMPLTPEP